MIPINLSMMFSYCTKFLSKFTISAHYAHLQVEMNSSSLLYAIITTEAHISSWSVARLTGLSSVTERASDNQCLRSFDDTIFASVRITYSLLIASKTNVTH